MRPLSEDDEGVEINISTAELSFYINIKDASQKCPSQKEDSSTTREATNRNMSTNKIYCRSQPSLKTDGRFCIPQFWTPYMTSTLKTTIPKIADCHQIAKYKAKITIKCTIKCPILSKILRELAEYYIRRPGKQINAVYQQPKSHLRGLMEHQLSERPKKNIILYNN
eukprot:GHVP01015459.1.p1 GENE.GHVP01015459.1~~GHVP01015459.1.p1  ORF type:complete len:167 (+),score=18.56 GHVP01015459.1:351-851(+)